MTQILDESEILKSKEEKYIFSILSFGTTIAFFIINFNLGKWLSLIFKKLGHMSYSVYLIHPITFWYSARFFDRTSNSELFLLFSVITTLVLSWIIYALIESKFIALGKRIVVKLHKKNV